MNLEIECDYANIETKYNSNKLKVSLQNVDLDFLGQVSEEQILQIIGQLEAGMVKIEPFLDSESYFDYCDQTGTIIAYWRTTLKTIRNNKN